MVFIVQEIQVNGDQVAILNSQFTDRLQAEASYHTILAAAALSSVNKHTAMIMTGTGDVQCKSTYCHPSQTTE